MECAADVRWLLVKIEAGKLKRVPGMEGQRRKVVGTQ
jgi:hypothetical protein